MILDLVRSTAIQPLRRWWLFLSFRMVLDAIVIAFIVAIAALTLFGNGLFFFAGLIVAPGILSLSSRGRDGVIGVVSFCVALLSVFFASISPQGLMPVFVLFVVLAWLVSFVACIKSVKGLGADRKRERRQRAVRMLYAASRNVRAARMLRGKNRAYQFK